MIRKHSLLTKLLALIMVLGLIVGCFAGCGDDSSNRDDDDDEKISSKDDEDDEDDKPTKPSDEDDKPTKPSGEDDEPSKPEKPSEDDPTEPSDDPVKPSEDATDPTTAPTTPDEKRVEYQWNGITFYLEEGFEESYSGIDYAAYYSDDMDIAVAAYELTDFGPGIVNSRKFANAYCNSFYDHSTVSKVDSVYYSTVLTDDGLEITGFYVEGDYGWVISAVLADVAELEEDAIRFVTSGSVESGTVPEVPAEPETITIWVPYEDQVDTEGWLYQMLDAFAKAHPEYNVAFNLSVCNEADAGYMVSSDPEAAADLYFYAHDYLETLLNAGALMPLTGTYADYVRANNSLTLVNTVTDTDGNICGFPIANNTWFMYYNKDFFTEDDVKSLDTMLEKGKVSFPMSTAWYGGAFFFGTGCTAFGPNGNDPDAGFQFGGKKGYAAAKKMVEIAQHPNFVDDASGYGVFGLEDGVIGAAFTGSWDYQRLYNALGDRLGVAAPPMMEIDGKMYQMRSFGGSKAIGVNPYAVNYELVMELAAFLSSAESQLARYEDRGVIPCHPALLENPVIQKDPVAMAEIYTMTYCSVMQPALREMSNYWDPMGNFGAWIVNGEIDLRNYQDYVDMLMSRLNDSGL